MGKLKEWTEIETCILVRPLLTIHKADIFTYAHEHHIPYLKNTTPEWSNRGKFRNRFLGEFIEQYGDMGITNIHRVAEKLEKYGNMIFKLFINPRVKQLCKFQSMDFTDELLNNEDVEESSNI